MQYDLNLLRTFLALMEEQNVTRTARRLGITQPALSNSLARLRSMLRDPLFVRERYGIRPTPKAEQLAPSIAAALASLDALILGQQEFDPAAASQAFTIAPNSYVELVLMPSIVKRVGSVAPGVKLRLTPFGSDLAETGATSGQTAMVIGRIHDPPDNLIVQHLMDEGFACVVRADHPRVRNKLSEKEFEQLKHVNVLPPGRLRVGLFQLLERQRLRRDVAVSVTHFLAVPEMIAVTDYCATLPALLCRRLAGDPRLKVVPTPVDLGTFPVEMAWHVRYRNDPAHAWLRAQVVDAAKAIARARA
jgi:DNA-binding transcriptional LysR family regulator